jgi:hypothetical protein
MTIPDRPLTGRERRRKGALNRTRRFLYGLMLLMAVPVGAVAGEFSSFGKIRNLIAPPAPARSEVVTVDGLLVLRAGADGGPEVTLESATARVPQKVAGAAPEFRIEPRRAEGADGTAFDLTLGDLGSFRLVLRSERTAALSAWSLGGTLYAALGAGHAAATTDVPTLRINDMYGNETRYLAFDASVRPDASEPGLAFRWRI